MSYRWLENLRQSNKLLHEPGRCVHVGDRESDIYELYSPAQKLGASFRVRVQTNRLASTKETAENGGRAQRIFQRQEAVPWAVIM